MIGDLIFPASFAALVMTTTELARFTSASQVVVAPGQLPGRAISLTAFTLMEGNCPVLMERVVFFELVDTRHTTASQEQFVSSLFFPT